MLMSMCMCFAFTYNASVCSAIVLLPSALKYNFSLCPHIHFKTVVPESGFACRVCVHHMNVVCSTKASVKLFRVVTQ